MQSPPVSPCLSGSRWAVGVSSGDMRYMCTLRCVDIYELCMCTSTTMVYDKIILLIMARLINYDQYCQIYFIYIHYSIA